MMIPRINSTPIPKKKTMVIVTLLLLTTILPLFISEAEAEGDLSDSSWPKFRRDLQNTGRNEHGISEVSNQTRWTFQTDAVIDCSPTIGPDGTIYIGSHDGTIYAVERDGSLSWSYEASSTISTSPAIAEDGTIYFVTTDGGFYSLNEDGAENWVLEDLLEQEGELAGPVISSPVIREDGTVLVASEEVYSVYPNGTVEWKYVHTFEGEDHPSPGQVQSTPAIDDEGNIYFGYSVNTPMGDIGLLLALNPEGEQIWQYEIRDDQDDWDYGAGVRSSPAISEDGKIYFGSYNNRLYALNKENGTEVWNYETGGDIFSSPAIGHYGTIYVGSADNNLSAVHTERTDGEAGTEKWRFEAGGEVHSSPAVGPEGMIYFGSYDNHTYSLYSNGTERWSVETENSVFSSPALSSEGTLYIGSFDGKIYGLGIPDEEETDIIPIFTNVLPIILAILFISLLSPRKDEDLD